MDENQKKGNNNNSLRFKLHFRVYSIIKRAFDIIFSLAAIILTAIPMLLIAFFIKADSSGKAVFKQKRIGRHGKLFDIYKFRTMTSSAPHYCASANLSNADSYITRIGKVLRKTSLDELPQLFNILKGDMSFIGPRPLIPEEKYIHCERMRLGIYRLRPGITGYAQINGRDWVTPEQKVAMDKVYLANFGAAFDTDIFFKTVSTVLKRDGIHEGVIQTKDEA